MCESDCYLRNENPKPHERKNLTAEYNALRAEILKRVEQRQQIMVATLTIAGVILGLGVRETEPLAVLAFPPVAMALAYSWSQVNYRIGELGKYIQCIECQLGLGWEEYLSSDSRRNEMSPSDKTIFLLASL